MIFSTSYWEDILEARDAARAGSDSKWRLKPPLLLERLTFS